jgi:thiosulfate dehydrogenase
VVACLTSACGARAEPPGDAALERPADSVPSYRNPTDAEIPAGPVGAAIRRGRAIFAATGDSLPGFVGNDLRCTSCHLDNGTRPWSAPFVGVYSRFPQYRSRNDRINVIDDRINDCFERSMAGKPLPRGGRDLADMAAYLAFMSRGVPPPGEVFGAGFKRLTPLEPDTTRGRQLYVSQCVRCHGARGEGLANPDPAGDPARYPPLWGPGSFTVGAGMARLRTAAAFIRENMPFDLPGTLTDQDAFDVAAYVVSQPRPDFARKADDWPRGDPPPDVAYRTRAAPDRGADIPVVAARRTR